MFTGISNHRPISCSLTYNKSSIVWSFPENKDHLITLRNFPSREPTTTPNNSLHKFNPKHISLRRTTPCESRLTVFLTNNECLRSLVTGRVERPEWPSRTSVTPVCTGRFPTPGSLSLPGHPTSEITPSPVIDPLKGFCPNRTYETSLEFRVIPLNFRCNSPSGPKYVFLSSVKYHTPEKIDLVCLPLTHSWRTFIYPVPTVRLRRRDTYSQYCQS